MAKATAKPNAGAAALMKKKAARQQEKEEYFEKNYWRWEKATVEIEGQTKTLEEYKPVKGIFRELKESSLKTGKDGSQYDMFPCMIEDDKGNIKQLSASSVDLQDKLGEALEAGLKPGDKISISRVDEKTNRGGIRGIYTVEVS